jgi:8-oxo-dGTP pyrophosphatase MutT (NUDIX family)
MVASSILPVAIKDDKLYFLFGEENDREDSAKGFSDFGGRIEGNEQVVETALREGSEELSGFLGNMSQLSELIKNNGGTMHIYDEKNKYNIHIFYIDYDKNLPIYYNQNHDFLWTNMDNQLLNDSKLFEKKRIDWFSIEDIKRRKSEFRNFYQEITELFIKKEQEIYRFLQNNQKNTNADININQTTKKRRNKKMKKRRRTYSKK